MKGIITIGLPAYIITAIAQTITHAPLHALPFNFILAAFAWTAAWVITDRAYNVFSNEDVTNDPRTTKPLFHQLSPLSQIVLTLFTFCPAALLVLLLIALLG